MIRIAICDDDTIFLQHAVKLIERWSGILRSESAGISFKTCNLRKNAGNT